MSNNVKLVPRCTDDQILKLFDRLAVELEFSNFNFYLYGSEIRIDGPSRKKLRDEIANKSGFSIRYGDSNRRPDEPAQNQNLFSLTFERGQRVQGGLQSSLHTDSITFNQGHLIHPETAIKINEIIETELGASLTSSFTGIDDTRLGELSRNHQQFLDGMRRQLSAVGEELTKARIEGERELRERKGELDRAAKEEKAKLFAEYEARVSAIKAEKAKLEEREKQLDDRNNTHARRDLQKNLQEHLAAYKTKFQLTEDTRKLRQPVIRTVIAIESVCILLLAIIFLLPPQGPDFWDKAFFWLKSFGVTFVATGTAVWFLRWLTQWSARHADAEFQLRQLELDISRASWVVETTFEWKASQDSTIPVQLLDAISRNLFISGESRHEAADSPADHLASALLGDASRVKLKSGDHEIELDRAAIKRAKRPHERE
ncbi:hypothetical protein [Falsiroseomonas stagni]|uniref:Uncharacterized protein n=1 Tax=Falsiroseomonas stagni DSM 19981 TaxID=1123062 RepID=A0A1I4D2L9_9PROT|nr:hypothetical protein [Falsiroseomonas stagni]SFK87954.1 hypothetical protein SAMN02745775_109132 [Falsiroseomonas stagni DSM 19981]